MRLVLDTNVVLDLAVFRDPGVAALRESIDAKLVVVVASPAGLEELRRVLAYPRLGLDSARQEAAYDWYASIAEAAGDPPAQGLLPRCQDPDDQKFLDLAWVEKADHLVTKDKALLDLARRAAKLGRFLVTSPTDLRRPDA